MEAYRQTLEYYAAAPRPPQVENDVNQFLTDLQTPPDFPMAQGMIVTANWVSPAYNDVNMYADMGMGVGNNGFIEQQWRETYGQLFQQAAQQILEFLDNPPEVNVEEMFPGPIPVPQPFGMGVRQRKRRGFMGALDELIRGHGLKAISCACGGATKRETFLKTYKVADRPYNLQELSAISKVPLQTLQEVYNRGIGAYKTNPQSVRLKGSFVKNVKAPMSAKLSKEQWAMARVFSFLVGGEHDEDLRGGGKTQDYLRALETIRITDQYKDRFRNDYDRLTSKPSLTPIEQGALQNIIYVLAQREEAKKIIDELDEERKKLMKKIEYGMPEDKRRPQKSKPLEPLEPVEEVEDEGSGKRVAFARKYLRGRGIRATKGNVQKMLNAMDVEGVVFEG